MNHTDETVFHLQPTSRNRRRLYRPSPPPHPEPPRNATTSGTFPVRKKGRDRRGPSGGDG